jgi:ATP-dependent RNA helicase DeaD
VLTPTRELAVQVSDELLRVGKYVDASVLAVYGGQSIETQLRALRHGVHIVVGTPGRIIDHVKRGTLELSGVGILVIDEADRMLDMGFIDDVEFIIRKTPAHRQTLLFSATMPAEVRSLANRYMREPQFVKTGEDAITVKNIEQYHAETHPREKFIALCAYLKAQRPHMCIIFTRTKHGADALSEHLYRKGFKSLCLHGNLSQNQRDRAIASFRSGHNNLLVATDLAARGLDILEVSHVINFDMPDDATVYVHRIGRTGRAGRGGIAMTFTTPDQRKQLYAIEKFTGVTMKDIKIEGIQTNLPASAYQSEGYSGRRREHGQRHGGHGERGGHSHGQHGHGGHARRGPPVFNLRR